MTSSRFVLVMASLCVLASGQTTTPDVGSGSPTEAIRQQFQIAYYRNGFAYQVSYPPLADVKRLGANGLVQEFQDAAKTSNVRLALILPNVNTPIVEGRTAVFQMQATMYSYFSSVGVNTAGMPAMDTANCPSLITANSCTYQLFDKPYALFVFKNAVNNAGANYFTRDPFYTRWNALGGVAAFGPAITAETAVTASTGTKATTQYYDRGAIYNVTSGTNSGRIFGVKAPIYTVFSSSGGDAGFLGLPTSEEVAVANGRMRQTFEGGSIEYDPADPNSFPTLRYPVASIALTAPASPVRLELGQSLTVQANVFGPNGIALSDRAVLWTTTNGRVVTVQSGNPTVVKAVGGGTAIVTASSEGKNSAPLTFVVAAPCCQIGEGSPNIAVSQAFQDAVARNRLNLKLPAAKAVSRVGAGFVQQFESADANAVYLIAVPDRTLTGFVVSGRLLVRYLELGGPAGTLGYPLMDASAAGRQNFEQGALAGDPVQLVAGEILAKWGVLGYERGVAGLPVSAPGAALTFRATQVSVQAFENAQLIAVSGRALKTYAVSGLIQAKYAAAGGAVGRFGAPLDDEYGVDNLRRQDFEGGRIEYAAGDSEARANETARQPVVVATPTSVLAGARVRLAIGGFNENASVRVSVTGQTDFVVNVGNGAHVWDSFVPASARSGVVTVRAVDSANAASSAQATYTVRTLSEARLQVVAIGGDGQTGVPGAALALPLAVEVRDESGNAVAGIPVKFTASPGAFVDQASAATDANGRASARLRLPNAEGVALLTAEAGRAITTLSARAAATSLANFQRLTQAVDGVLGEGPETIRESGAMLAAATSMVRYLQSRGLAASPNGVADIAGLNAYLRGVCALDAAGLQVCDGFVRTGESGPPVVNLWRVPGFAGGTLAPEMLAPDTANVRDLLAAGLPVLVAIEIRSGAAAVGGHAVVATGVAADGSILIADPDPASTRTTLDAYLAGGAVVTGVAALVPGASTSGGFLIAGNAAISVASASGVCGTSFEIAGRDRGGAVGRAGFRYCEGDAPLYQVDLSGSSFRGAFTDMGARIARSDLIGGGTVHFKVVRTAAEWTIAPMDIAIAAGGVVNAASFAPAVAPGGMAAVFGAGFGTDRAAVRAEISGVAAPVLSVSPFQMNIQIPAAAQPGLAALTVTSAAGTASADLTVADVAPALFTLASGQAAAINRDGSVNSSVNPARRGEVLLLYGTGFGAVEADGSLMRVQTPLKVVVGGTVVPVAFAGLAPGFPGLYQVNLVLPASMAPGLELPVSIQQGNSTSNTVQIAVQ